jgi:peptidoglycan hydrolase CwlO-like protein
MSIIETLAVKATRWIGSVPSLIIHTILFISAFGFLLLGISLDQVLLVLTTLLSFEAIYLSIFIQMSVNRHEKALEEVGQDIEEIQEDVEDINESIEEIQEDVEDITEDIEEIQEDMEDINENIEEIQEEEAAHAAKK